MKDPFGFPESSVERLLREERERTRLLGGGTAAQAILEATDVRKRLGLDFGAPYRGVLDMLERDRRQQLEFRQLTSSAWALSISETARSIVDRNAGLLDDQRRLSSSLLDTVKTFDLKRSTMASVIAAAATGGTYRRMIEEALPRLSAFSPIAEQMRLLDAMTLRASEGVIQSATALATEMVLETQRIAEAILAASTDEESAELQGRLIDLIVGFVQQLGPRTIAELHEMGLFQWSGWLAGILGLLLAIAALHPDQSPEEKAAFAALNQKVEALQQETRRYHEAEARADEAYVADLPRAELSRDATFRRDPFAGVLDLFEDPQYPYLDFDVAFSEADQLGRVLVTFSGEQFGIDVAARLIQHCARSALPFGFEWASDCDRLRIGEFGGGYVVISEHGISYGHTTQLLDRAIAGHGMKAPTDSSSRSAIRSTGSASGTTIPALTDCRARGSSARPRPRTITCLSRTTSPNGWRCRSPCAFDPNVAIARSTQTYSIVAGDADDFDTHRSRRDAGRADPADTDRDERYRPVAPGRELPDGVVERAGTRPFRDRRPVRAGCRCGQRYCDHRRLSRTTPRRYLHRCPRLRRGDAGHHRALAQAGLDFGDLTGRRYPNFRTEAATDTPPEGRQTLRDIHRAP